MIPRNVRVGEVFKNIRRATHKRKRSISDIMSPLGEGEGTEVDGEHGEPPFKLTKVEHSWVREDLLRDLDNDRLTVLDELLDDAEPAEAAETHDAVGDGKSWEPLRPAATEHFLSDHGEFPTSSLASLTSLERTRYRKRMYMRRKRAKDEAIVRGEDARNATGDGSMSRLKVGRKKTKTIEVSSFPEPPMEHAGDDDDEGEEKLSLRPRRSVKFQRIKSVLQCAGFTANDLVTDGLDLLYLSRLGNLAGMYSRSHVDPCDHVFLGTSMSFRPSKTRTSLPVPAIRYSTLQLLRAYIKSYLDSLISLCITIATAEHQAKQRSKVWRGEANTISAVNVQKAVRMMKGRYLTRTSFIRQLPPRLKLNLVVSEDIGGSISDFVDPIPHPTLPGEPDLLDDIGGAFLLLPLSLQRPGPDFEDEMEHFLRIDGRGFNLPESEIIPDEDDTAKLWDVARQEKKLDARDRKLDVEYERELCTAFNKDFQELEEKDEDTDDEDEVGIGDEHTGAGASGISHPHGRGSKASTFKSQEYIVSSDEDSQTH
ncbi:hypothetical protein BS47DRAFT_1211901 [Hydnum rufescens UP504]|uniref:Uncharacterized protein n=1 Tax=Hydnum rufescens UP504 TaxID=1448309 RepID=A0A9P6DRC1_9AGAM|nr:hypothetical protein BS47DRAFT_1211901 [Hydnum rufescens UP504]